MPNLRMRLDLLAGRSTRQVWLFALVVGVTLAALSAATSSRVPSVAEAPDASSSVFSATGSARGTNSATATDSVISADAVTGASTPALSQRAAVHTMSMDAPIQHGLTAHQEQAISARLVRTHQDASVAPRSSFWTPAMGRSAVARARSWIGMPYSWAGGDSTGPTLGRCVPGSGGDLDCHVVGFDCSGLMMYAWGPYAALPHLAATQQLAGLFHPTLAQLQPGDLVFFAGYLPGGTGHVAMYSGHGNVIEAPQSGSVVHETPLSTVLADDGAYRGAVRPLSGATPTLMASNTHVPTSGALVALRGTGLAQVDAVHIGRDTVTQFVRRSDSLIEFRAPAHAAGTLAVTVSTIWKATSKPVTMTYVKPAPKPRTTPVTLAPSSPPPSTTPSTKPTTHPSTKPTTKTSTAPTTSSSPSATRSSSRSSVTPSTTVAPTG